ncbi:MAG: acyl transferase [Bacteroidetes bacterium GWF2_41_9]|nr:MAG: acyl transferase [Bacteroidetes bacterium GWA2_40_15]OFY58533.1 MAG: acyl transferase [Bacteroidetes bacterium GWF2_41_9]HBQ82802.1 acyl transferase [Bacteroidales bacterium]
MNSRFRDKIFTINNQTDFNNAVMHAYDYQLRENAVYQNFAKHLKKRPENLLTLTEIPFLPVEFFRNHKVITGDKPVEKVFESSGTTGVMTGKHHVCDPGLYTESFVTSFRLFYGDPGEYMIAALLPSYTEQENSSLVYMANGLIKLSQNPLSGFYREQEEALILNIISALTAGEKVLLLGVSFALLDLAEERAPDLSGVIVMETGGMKGRRKEVTRYELHSILKKRFNVKAIHSEYGMTELLSQAYSKGEGIFYCPPWMKIVLRDTQDPLTTFTEPGRTGGINIIDLANIYSCSFIATGDLGRLHEDGGFEVLGRFDNSDIRGCNLLS